MARPPYLLRHTSYRQAESAGQPISTSQLDAEFNDDYEVTNQLNRLLRGITDASGRLVNISAQLAQSLVGSTRFTPTIATTVFLTTVAWDASFSSGNVQVIVSGVILDTATYSVADSGGFLEVTVAVSVSSGWVFISAYSQGAGIATMLASTDPGDGASQVGINDIDALYISTNVEGALAEIATSFNALLVSLGTISNIWTNAGVTVAGGPATNDFQMGSNRVIDLADAVDPTDAVTLQQLQAITQNISTLLAQFIRADGSVPWTANQSLASFKITDAGTPTMPGDLANKAYVDAVPSLAVGTVIDFIGSVAPSPSWLLCDGSAYLAAPYPALNALLPASYKTGSTQGCIAAFFGAIALANLTAGVLTSLPVFVQGVGYSGVPHIDVINTDGGAAVTLQPTWTASVSGTALTGAVVTGGVLSASTLTGGTGIREGAVIRVFNITEATFGGLNLPALVELPAGYFRTPDFRGRTSIGPGLLSKTAGIVDPPAIGKGDGYDGTAEAVDDFAGEQQHKLTVAELAAHSHTMVSGSFNGGTQSVDVVPHVLIAPFPTNETGGDLAHNNMQPYLVLNKIIKAL